MRHTFTLANGVEIPAVGFGTYKAAADNDEAIISEAIRQGYRHLDTADSATIQPCGSLKSPVKNWVPTIWICI